MTKKEIFKLFKEVTSVQQEGKGYWHLYLELEEEEMPRNALYLFASFNEKGQCKFGKREQKLLSLDIDSDLLRLGTKLKDYCVYQKGFFLEERKAEV